MISDYVKTIYPHHEKSISSILATLRGFLKFLYLNQYINEDLSLKVPKQKNIIILLFLQFGRRKT
jgi:hypothetical protein